MAKLQQVGEAVTPGERAAAEHLARVLPSNYVVISNLEFCTPSGMTREIDFLVVAPHGLYLVDEKSIHGDIIVTDNSWVLSGGEARRNPIANLEGIGRALKGRITRRFGTSLSDLAIQSTVLMSTTDYRLRPMPGLERQLEHVIPVSNSKKYFTDLNLLTHPGCSSPRLAEFMHDLLGTELKPRYLPKQIGFCTVEKRLAEGPLWVSFLAHLPAGGGSMDLVLKVYRLDQLRTQDERDAQLRVLLRDLEACNQLAEKGLAPKSYVPFPWSDDRCVVVPSERPAGRVLTAALDGQTPVRTRLRVLRRLLSALGAIHGLGIIHRNIHPGSIRIVGEEATGSVLLTDFDFARVEGTFTLPPDMGQELDSPYVAPEVMKVLGSATRASDIYSFGAVAFDILWGRSAMASLPFDQPTSPDLPPIDGLPSAAAKDLADMLAAMCSLDLRSRPKDVQEALGLFDFALESAEQP